MAPDPGDRPIRARLTRGARAASELARSLADEWRDDRISGLAAEIAFFGLLSLVPSMLVLAGALGSLEWILGGEIAERAESTVLDYLERVLTSEASGTIDAVRELFAGTSATALTVGFVVSLWAASRAFVAMIRALDIAYDVEERRSYLRLRAQALGFALGSVVVGTLLLAVVVLGPLLGTGREIADTVGLGGGFALFWNVFRWPAVFGVVVVWAATVFHLGPDHATPWRWDLPGALFAAAGWVLASAALRLYLEVAGRTNEVLGSLGGSLIVLVWLYLLGVVLLVGAEVNALLAHRYGVVQRRRH